MQPQATSQLPSDVRSILSRIHQQGGELRVQAKNENGKWIDRLQCSCNLLSSDWEKLRRFKTPIIRELRRQGLIDESFSDVGTFQTARNQKQGRESFLASDEGRKLRSEQSDARARQSKVVVKKQLSEEQKEHKRQLNRESHARNRARQGKAPGTNEFQPVWTEAQIDFIKRAYFDNDIWPWQSIRGQENERRKAAVLETVASKGKEMSWGATMAKIRRLMDKGEIPKKIPRLSGR